MVSKGKNIPNIIYNYLLDPNVIIFSVSYLLGGRPRPLAPTCNICLIRNNRSTIWCEVTSSIRTRSLHEENPEAMIASGSMDKKKANSCPVINANEISSDDEQVKELLLCLRPIRDGDNVPVVQNKIKIISDVKSEKNQMVKVSSQSSETNVNRPMKKRPLPESTVQSCKKKPLYQKSDTEAEKSVVESLILMSSHKT